MSVFNSIARAVSGVIPHRGARKKVRMILNNAFVSFGAVNRLCDLAYSEFRPHNELIGPKDKCLVIAPHPDDEVIGCGGIMAKYAAQFDCVVVNSSGFVRKDDTLGEEEIADERIAEFNSAMDFLGIKNRWIFKIFGKIPHFDKMIEQVPNYLKTLNLAKYDYIFVPDRFDGHREHRFVTNHLVPLLMRRGGYNKRGFVCQYNVWGTVFDPNYFEDISAVAAIKEQAILKYHSRTFIKDNYAKRIAGLNYFYGMLMGVRAGIQAAEAYHVEPTKDYLARKDDKSWAKYNK